MPFIYLIGLMIVCFTASEMWEAWLRHREQIEEIRNEREQP